MILNKTFGNNNFFIGGIISGTLMSHDYRALGLKSGLEIHQQLDTKEKLFCGCPTLLRDTKESNFEFFRYLRPTQSEMGVVDKAALEEIKLIKKFIYKAYDTTCLVENDEEPPRELNEEAVDISLMVGGMMNMQIVDELYTMRKIVIDGSNTSGFQRTGLVATQGYIDSSAGRVGIDVLCLEEEAAQKVEDKGDSIIYSLDRLGIPLVEIGTAPDIVSPAHAREVAEQIGMILRSTGKVKRGIGTIRQDVNISIAGGARVEIKGVQELALIETIVDREVTRQVALLGMMEELNKSKAEVTDKIIDVTSVFSNTTSKVILKALKGGVVYAVNLPGFSGFVGKEIQPGRRLGTEFSDRAKKSGVGGIFHTDELPNYGIAKKEVEALRNAVGAKEMDCVVMVADSKEKAQGAMEAVIIRAGEALKFIPEETRRALPDGNSSYMRPLPGAARMYPETDVPPVVITEERIRNIILPELLSEIIEKRKTRYIKDFKLNDELARQIAGSSSSPFIKQINSPFMQQMLKQVNSPFMQQMLKQVNSPSMQQMLKQVNSPSMQQMLKQVNSPSMQQILTANYDIFENIMKEVPNASATLVVRTLESILYELENEEVPIINITGKHLIQLFKLQSEGNIPNEAIKEILKIIAEKPEFTIEQASQSLGIGGVQKGELEIAIDKLIEEKTDFIQAKGINSVGPLMGIIMKDFRGKVSGEEVSSILKETITIGLKLYEAAEKQNMIEQLKELRRNVSASNQIKIDGGFNGILRALGAQMDREKGLENNWDTETGRIAYKEAEKIDHLIEKLHFICKEVDDRKNYFGMLRQLGLQMTLKHGKLGDI